MEGGMEENCSQHNRQNGLVSILHQETMKLGIWGNLSELHSKQNFLFTSIPPLFLPILSVILIAVISVPSFYHLELQFPPEKVGKCFNASSGDMSHAFYATRDSRMHIFQTIRKFDTWTSSSGKEFPQARGI